MGQKVNPISLRLEKTNRHFDSCWYDDYNYTDLFLQDLKIKNYLKVVLNQITYPEGRISIENLPKKTSINLFYHNPTSSRQKKNILFQLQNFKENKKDFAEKNKYSFFCFPEQKHWTDKKMKIFPLAQQGIEEIRTIYSEIHKKGVTLSNEYKENKNNNKNKVDLRPPFSDQILTFQQKKPSIPYTPSHTNKTCTHYCLSKANNNFNPFFLPTSFKRDTENNINGKLLEFVVNSRNYNKFENRDIHEKWAIERFFVRYLYAQFYCKFLQNKIRDNQEDAHTFSSLYMFLIFMKRYEKNSTKVTDFTAKKGIRSILPSVSFPSQKTKRVSFKRTRNHKHFLSGLYSSKPSFKSHLESFLYNSENNFFNINFFRALTEKQSALFLVQEIIHYLERKVPFRRIKTQILREIPRYKRIKGIRITCSGRVGGRSKKAQRSKTQSAKIGQTSLGVFSSKIDFACRSAYTRFGLIGVKVWICYQ